jgi:hypothetical protein
VDRAHDLACFDAGTTLRFERAGIAIELARSIAEEPICVRCVRSPLPCRRYRFRILSVFGYDKGGDPGTFRQQ